MERIAHILPDNPIGHKKWQKGWRKMELALFDKIAIVIMAITLMAGIYIVKIMAKYAIKAAAWAVVTGEDAARKAVEIWEA